MRASTTYHLQAAVQLPDRSLVTNADQVFTTRAIPAELLSYVQGSTQNLLCTLATDSSGNVIWYYALPPGVFPFPVKQLPNGHMLLIASGAENDVREIDLAGNIINQITVPQIATRLAGIPSFQNAVLNGFDHDVLALPNGHLILLATIQQTINNVPGVPAGSVVVGNALIDWDPQKGVVWTWSTFDHLDLAHAPFGISDWTHGNAVIYSPDDGNLIFSMRNQNWVAKINYKDGAGDGSILWRFGPGGDFTLANQGAPVEWNYGQHYPTITSPNSSGIFSLMVFNNGNNRFMDTNNDACGSTGVAACYSSVPIFELNEYTMAANVLWEDNLSPAYSFCCGDALVLSNGDIEFDVATDPNFPNISYIQEVTQTQSPDLIWQMNIQGQPGFFDLLYRGFRIPSLYPGVEWTQSAVAAANASPAIQH
jgi:hypothetical protein